MADLLQPPPEDRAIAYHAQVVLGLNAPVEVRPAGPGRGKGIFALQDFAAGDVIFQERALVSQQDSASQEQVTACAQCHCFVGTVEQRIAQLLLNVQRRAKALSATGGQEDTLQGFDAAAVDDAEEEDEDEEEMELKQRAHLLEAYVAPGQLDQLASGHLTLPHSQQIPLPAPVACAYGCGETYCSTACMEAAWQHHHCLLCPGSATSNSSQQTPTGAAPAGGSGSSSSAAAAGGSGGSSSSAPQPAAAGTGAGSSGEQQGVQQPPATVHGMEVDRQAMRAFLDHSMQTNDVFRLAAKLVAIVALKANSLTHNQSLQPLEACVGSEQPAVDPIQPPTTQPDCNGNLQPSTTAELSPPTGTSQDSIPCAPDALQPPNPAPDTLQPPQQSQPTQPPAPLSAAAALEQAWLPFAVGWKRLWWEAVAVPDDVAEAGEEQEFREQLRELASDSLSLLCAALPGVASSWPPLVQLHTWGGVIGMFELNNLGLTVPSPVEDFFLLVDGLAEPERSQAQAHTQPWLDALDKWYDTPSEGTGFFALQSCANHSCAPSAATEGLADGRVSVYALKAIRAGQEVTISYLDEGEEEGGEALTYQQRQAALRDYGFTCTCDRCETERVGRNRKAGRKGVKLGRR